MTIKSILYTVIARGSTILVKYASCVGNFAEVTEQILTKIPPENSKLTYSHMSFLFHYVKEDNITYLCITDDVSLHLQILSNMFLKNKLCCFWVS
jgi:vesicle-associated membrane protein 7